MVIIVVTLQEVRINVYYILISESRPYVLSYRQGRINHWANRANARGLALGYQNAPLLVLHVFRLFTTRQNCRAFWLLRLVHRSEKLVTLAFIVFEWLRRVEANSTTLYDPRIRPKSAHPWTSAEIFPGWGSVEILLILYRLLTMQCKWTFTKCFSLFTSLICAGWTSILNRLSETFKCFFINYLISIFWTLSTNKSWFKNNQGPEQHERWKNTLTKLFQAMRSRNICWQDHRTTY